MKKVFIFAMATIFATGCISCRPKDKDVNEGSSSHDIKFESYTYDLIGEYFGADSIDAPGGRLVRYIGQGVLPQDIGDTDINNLRDTLLHITGVRFVDGTPEPALPDSVRISDLASTDTEACGEYISTLTTTLVTPRAIVWENNSYAYPCHAAHGNTTTKYINFCLTDGKIIALKDLLKPDYQKHLQNIIRKKLKAGGYDLLIPLDQIDVPAQFGLTSKGIIFSYDPYQIAPYSEGTIQVEVSAGELVDILNRHGQYILLGITEKE